MFHSLDQAEQSGRRPLLDPPLLTDRNGNLGAAGGARQTCVR
jgi:hypothetical protein